MRLAGCAGQLLWVGGSLGDAVPVRSGCVDAWAGVGNATATTHTHAGGTAQPERTWDEQVVATWRIIGVGWLHVCLGVILREWTEGGLERGQMECGCVGELGGMWTRTTRIACAMPR